MAKSGIQVSATIPAEVHDALVEYRFDRRIDKMTDVIREAIIDFASREAGYVPAEADVEA